MLIVRKKFKVYIFYSLDDINLQTSSGKNSQKNDRGRMLLVADSNCIDNFSSREIVINKSQINKDNIGKIHSKNADLSKKDHLNVANNHNDNNESAEELPVIDINLQSDNSIPVEGPDKEDESIVIAYLKNKDALFDPEKILSIARRKSSIFENVPTMESIPENEHFPTFSSPTKSKQSQRDL